ncbi:MAG: hypothetical protein HWQ38_37865 [Nostoc sp. NMS7]|uniref:hypothetical protein n=1 Tax=Nostoc sp. NMS7 TaxID=2815391 RepID=UPI0025D39784|nr:hypothetical protein [Nostoc sp. NMS7]MBN3951925.1 hypothetical protein [Nostoc sp. NMS7]
MSVPVTLYSPDGKRDRQIAAIDAPGWIGKGWLKEPPIILPPVVPTLASTPVPVPEPQELIVIDSAALATLGASETQVIKRSKS